MIVHPCGQNSILEGRSPSRVTAWGGFLGTSPILPVACLVLCPFAVMNHGHKDQHMVVVLGPLAHQGEDFTRENMTGVTCK